MVSSLDVILRYPHPAMLCGHRQGDLERHKLCFGWSHAPLQVKPESINSRRGGPNSFLEADPDEAPLVDLLKTLVVNYADYAGSLVIRMYARSNKFP